MSATGHPWVVIPGPHYLITLVQPDIPRMTDDEVREWAQHLMAEPGVRETMAALGVTEEEYTANLRAMVPLRTITTTGTGGEVQP